MNRTRVAATNASAARRRVPVDVDPSANPCNDADERFSGQPVRDGALLAQGVVDRSSCAASTRRFSRLALSQNSHRRVRDSSCSRLFGAAIVSRRSRKFKPTALLESRQGEPNRNLCPHVHRTQCRPADLGSPIAALPLAARARRARLVGHAQDRYAGIRLARVVRLHRARSHGVSHRVGIHGT